MSSESTYKKCEVCNIVHVFSTGQKRPIELRGKAYSQGNCPLCKGRLKKHTRVKRKVLVWLDEAKTLNKLTQELFKMSMQSGIKPVLTTSKETPAVTSIPAPIPPSNELSEAVKTLSKADIANHVKKLMDKWNGNDKL